MVRKRGNRWQADAIVDGKRSRPTFGTEREALEYERKAEEGIDPTAVVTLGAYIDEQFDALWGGYKAEYTHKVNCRLIKRGLGEDTPLASITERMIDDWIARMRKQGSKNGTINRKLAALSKILRRAERHKLIGSKPYIEDLPEEAGRELVLTKEQEKKARLYFEHAGMEIEGALFDFLLYTGCRIGEALKVTLQDRNSEGVVFKDRKNKKKGGTISVVPLVGPAVTAWDTACAALDSRTKTARPFGDNIQYIQFLRNWALLREHMSIPEWETAFVPHMLRHTCCTRLVQGGAPMPKVMKWMGHQKIQTTMRYAHLIPKDLEDISSILMR